MAVKTALIDTGPRPFSLQCSAPWGALCDTTNAVSPGYLISDILIDTRVHLVAGKLTSAEWLAPGARRGGLRNPVRRLVAALLPGCIYWRRTWSVAIRFLTMCRCHLSGLHCLCCLLDYCLDTRFHDLYLL